MMVSTSRTSRNPSLATNLEDYGKAMLNILEDFSEEKGRLEGVQRAIINILEDFSEEKARLEDTQTGDVEPARRFWHGERKDRGH